MSQIDISAKLENRCVGDLSGNYFIPDYQRGYRWGRQNVRQLLKDIKDNKEESYYLQPIVVCPHIKKNGDKEQYDYDVIDGQQRLTTIYIIKKALEQIYIASLNSPFQFIKKEWVECNFTLSYETRKGSKEYLDNISEKTVTEAQSFVDYLYMYHAYNEVQEWLEDNIDQAANIAKTLKHNVFLIWYEVNADEEQARAIFERLNIGKIRLTNAELIKALFLSSSSSDVDNRNKNIIGEQWDDMERQLHNHMFWSFLTNKDPEAYPTKIEILFDMIAAKKDNEREELSTFYYFDKILKEKNKTEEWKNIYLQFLKLKDWFNDREYYHKIGYLVAVGRSNTLQSLYLESCSDEMTNSKFKSLLDQKIKSTIDFDTIRIEDLAYGHNDAEIRRLLTLFNVMTMQQLKDETQRYPFHLHKNVGGGWSLEHIHAQQSESLNTNKQWVLWTKLHLQSLKRYHDLKILDSASQEEINSIMSLEERMKRFLTNVELQTQSAFNDISSIYARTVIVPGGTEYKDYLSNLALLGRDDNSMLNNSTFDVKREIVTKELMATSYVPLCTQRVFLKSYTPSDENQLFFWGQADRDAYIYEIKKVLKDYLPTVSHQIRKILSIKKYEEDFNTIWKIFENNLKLSKSDKDSTLKKKAKDSKVEDVLAYYESIIPDADNISKEDYIEKIKKVLDIYE